MPLGRIENFLSQIPLVRRVTYRLDSARDKVAKLESDNEALQEEVGNPGRDQYRRVFEWLKSQGDPDLAEVQSFNSRSRDRWVATSALSVPAGARVLDVGAGTAPYNHLFAHCNYETHDFEQYSGYKGPEGNYAKIDYVSDITNIPVLNESFDVILCTEVLEHVPRPIDALAEMVRITKPGGRLLITAPLGSGLHQEPYHFYGGYTPHWYRKFLGEFGCDSIHIEPNHGFFAHLAQECARFSWTFDDHDSFHGEFGNELSIMIGSILSSYFFSMDRKCFNPSFTVGYHVDARKYQ